MSGSNWDAPEPDVPNLALVFGSIGLIQWLGPGGLILGLALMALRNSDRLVSWLFGGQVPAAAMPLLPEQVRERLAAPALPAAPALAPPAAPALPAAQQAAQSAHQPATLALAELVRSDNLLIVGPKGSGKTTLLNAFIAMRTGSHCALDPHSTPGKWPCRVAGGGLDYAAIASVLDATRATMKSRYQQMARGALTEAQCATKRYTVVADEFRSISRNVDGASNTLLVLLSEGRKAGVCVLAAAHNDTATTLGITGEKSLLDCFDYIVYLGGLAVKRMPEAASMSRPACAYHTERGEYALLDTTHHAPTPVRAAPVALAADDRRAPVIATTTPDDGFLSALLADETATEPVDPGTGSGAVLPGTGAVEPGAQRTGSTAQGTGSEKRGTGIDEELVAALFAAGWSANRIIRKTGGNRAAVLDFIRSLRAQQPADRPAEDDRPDAGGDPPGPFSFLN